jgi:hypothetical protein
MYRKAGQLAEYGKSHSEGKDYSPGTRREARKKMSPPIAHLTPPLRL